LLAVVAHEGTEGGGIAVGEVGELDAEAHVAEVVEDFAAHLPPLALGQGDADVDRLAEERLDGFGLEQAWMASVWSRQPLRLREVILPWCS
jgi:hypothetical protein